VSFQISSACRNGILSTCIIFLGPCPVGFDPADPADGLPRVTSDYLVLPKMKSGGGTWILPLSDHFLTESGAVPDKLYHFFTFSLPHSGVPRTRTSAFLTRPECAHPRAQQPPSGRALGISAGLAGDRTLLRTRTSALRENFTFSLPFPYQNRIRMASRVGSNLPVVHMLMLLPGGNGVESGVCIFNLIGG
jgi:hypothetical protein